MKNKNFTCLGSAKRLKLFIVLIVVIVLIVSGSTTALALEYTHTFEDGSKMNSIINLDVPSSIIEKSNLTPEMFEALLSSELKGLGQAFADGEQLHNINGLFVLAIVSLESGYGTSSLARNNNNLGGIKGSGANGYREFISKQECVLYMFDLLDRLYISQGRDTIEAVSNKYCETGGWSRQVNSIMSDFIYECKEPIAN